jgi:hypothetical protein
LERKKEDSLFTDYMIVYVKHYEEFAEQLTELVRTFCTVAGYKVNIRKSVFLDGSNEQLERKFKSHCNSIKNVRYLGINFTKVFKTYA